MLFFFELYRFWNSQISDVAGLFTLHGNEKEERNKKKNEISTTCVKDIMKEEERVVRFCMPYNRPPNKSHIINVTIVTLNCKQTWIAFKKCEKPNREERKRRRSEREMQIFVHLLCSRSMRLGSGTKCSSDHTKFWCRKLKRKRH